MHELSLELLGTEAAAAHVEDWRRLAALSLEPNVFLDPSFALPAAQYLGRTPQFLFVRSASRLVRLCPLIAPARFAPWQIGVWTHEQAPLGTPLIDPQHAAQALAAIFSFCRDHWPNATALFIPALPRDGSVARLLLAQAEAEGRRVRAFNVHERAMLTTGKMDVARSLGSKRRKNIEAARRKLRAMGELAFRLSGEGAEIGKEIGKEFEEFFALESKGWKGRRGTALLKSAGRAAFARAALGALAAEGKCRIARLDCGGAPIAMGLVLQSGRQAYFWKIAYDESYAAFSPGVLLTLELSQGLNEDTSVARVDSCASPDHPMIDHLWRERLALADFLVELAPESRGFSAAAGVQWLRYEMRGRAKAALRRLRQMKSAILKRKT